jgi:hypothetical protein
MGQGVPEEGVRGFQGREVREGVAASEEESKFAPVQAVPEQGVLDLHVREEAELLRGGFDLGHHLLQCVSHE